MNNRFVLSISLLASIGRAFAEPAVHARSAEVQHFVAVDAPVVALTHVRVIDGTGAPARDDQTVLIIGRKLGRIGPASEVAVPPGATVLERRGHTVIPGLVGMHDHLFYAQFASDFFPEVPFSATRLYLASGVTTIRTAGAYDPYTDLQTKKWIDEGRWTGPEINITGPYLEGPGAFSPQMHELRSPDDARKTVAFWSEQGATSFKAYQHITRAQLRAAIAEAHRLGAKITAHLCAVTCSEAIEMGIDHLEHGLIPCTDFDKDKRLDQCPDYNAHLATLKGLDVESKPVRDLIASLVAHHVTLTSTLAVYESHVANRPPLSARVQQLLAPQAWSEYLRARTIIADPRSHQEMYGSKDDPWPAIFALEMRFERAFVKAGGLLVAGVDPTGNGGVLAGLGDQRELELLVEAGFTPIEAIAIATGNGARALGEESRIGTLQSGKQADLVLLRGDPSANIAAIEDVELVFKEGVGYDPPKMIESLRGGVGLY